jgi:SAM-dependent methyltransferase
MNNQINPDIFFFFFFPLSNKYDPLCVLNNSMGPHPLWLTEYTVQSLDLKPGMRVLDLGCGKGMTSVFLAREFGVQVYAVDFDEWGEWTSTDVRWQNAREHGVHDLVIPIKADARNLPFAKGFFDAIICVDAYIYFGQDEAYLENILKFLRPGGQISMIVPGYARDVTDGIPNYIKDFLGDELWTWQTLSWWKSLWEKDGLVSIDAADTLPNGCALWLSYSQAEIEFGPPSPFPDETHIHKQDLENGEYIGFIRMVATKK